VHPSPDPTWRPPALPALRWVAEQGAVRVDVLAHVLAPARPCSRTHASRVVATWRAGGLAAHDRRLADRPGLVWVTRAGRRAVGLHGRADAPPLRLLEHLHAVSLVRLGIERRGGRQWTCERALSAARSSRDAHVADARFCTPDGVPIAVEVELTPKGTARLGVIVDELTVEHDRVLYVIDDAPVGAAVARVAARLGVQDQVMIVGLEAFALPG
jgi:hypothetical protein